MHPHAALLTRFYTAFQERDAEAMIACYHPEVQFHDPVFRALDAPRAAAMWRMLCGRAKDLELHFSDVQADDAEGRAHWEALYTFSATGRRVLNRIDARFRFRDGRIADHRDAFDLWAWAGMALGAKGTLLGWTPLVKNAIHRQAIAGLNAFIEKQART